MFVFDRRMLLLWLAERPKRPASEMLCPSSCCSILKPKLADPDTSGTRHSDLPDTPDKVRRLKSGQASHASHNRGAPGNEDTFKNITQQCHRSNSNSRNLHESSGSVEDARSRVEKVKPTLAPSFPSSLRLSRLKPSSLEIAGVGRIGSSPFLY